VTVRDLPSFTSSEALLQAMTGWESRGIIRSLDLALARFFVDRVGSLPPTVVLAAVLVSHQLGRGHVCLDLPHVLEDPGLALDLPYRSADADQPDDQRALSAFLSTLSLEAWTQALSQATALVSTADRAASCATPLVLAGHRLYLRRYWHYERLVEAVITRRLAQTSQGVSPSRQPRWNLFVSTLGVLFPQPDESAHDGRDLDWQKVACAIAARSGFAVITGGPGTGKTTTVVRLLALLQAMALAEHEGKPLRIAVAAPTGKAAARLRTSLVRARSTLPELLHDQPALLNAIPSEVTTLHRLLGARADAREFRHHARQPLPIDLLVIDEASMIDLEMMAAVMQALPEAARLVLLGDKDQLSSVEAGGVLGQLCARAAAGQYSVDTAQWLFQATDIQLPPESVHAKGRALDQQVVMLRTSRRFDQSGGIGQLAGAIHAAKDAAVRSALTHASDAVRTYALMGPIHSALQRVFAQCLETGGGGQDPDQTNRGLAGFLRTLHEQRPSADASATAFNQWAAQVLQARSGFQVLCAVRAGPLGVQQANTVIEEMLARMGLIAPGGLWYEGRPVLVTRNDYGLGLMNGDMGVALSVATENPVTGARGLGLRVAFPSDADPGGVRWALPSRLTTAQTVFALTVHKSQGSEFDECLMVLPEAGHPALTRELLYTGVTRARHRFGLVAQDNVEEALIAAMARITLRAGGLFD